MALKEAGDTFVQAIASEIIASRTQAAEAIDELGQKVTQLHRDVREIRKSQAETDRKVDMILELLQQRD